jgi:beta-galactosidase
LRRSVGACEKFHGAVIEHVGTKDTRVFREVARLGKELSALGDQLLGADNPAQVGIIFDWDNYWALEYASGPNKDLKYVDQIHQYYNYFYKRNIPVDMIPVDADFSKYKAVVAPVLYMVKEGMPEAMEAYVNNGGTLVTGFMSGIVDQSDNVHLGGYPGSLRKMAGIWVEEIDALAPEQVNTLRFADGAKATCSLLCDIIHLEGAVSLADYTSNFYEGSPVVTKNVFGQGNTFYVGAQLTAEALAKVLDQVVDCAHLSPIIEETTELEVTCRVIDDRRYYFIINLTDQILPLPKVFVGKTDILSSNFLKEDTTLLPYDTLLVCERFASN